MPEYTVQISLTSDGHTEAHTVTGNTREWLSDKARAALSRLLARVPYDGEALDAKPETVSLPTQAEKPTHPCPPEGDAAKPCYVYLFDPVLGVVKIVQLTIQPKGF